MVGARALPTPSDDSASAWERALYAFLAEKERRSGYERFSTAEQRESHKDELNLLIIIAIAERTKSELVSRALETGVPLGAYQDAADLLRSPQLHARHALREIARDGSNTIFAPRVPWTLGDQEPPGTNSVVPSLGEANVHFYEEIGLTRSDIIAYEDVGVI